MRNYWSQKEREYFEKRKQIMSRSKIEWQERDLFWEFFENQYVPEKIYMNHYFDYDVTFEMVRARVSVNPVFTPLEEDFPGPVERWYGKVGKILFTLTYYYGHNDFMRIVCEENLESVKIIRSELDIFKSLNHYV